MTPLFTLHESIYSLEYVFSKYTTFLWKNDSLLALRCKNEIFKLNINIKFILFDIINKILSSSFKDTFKILKMPRSLYNRI